MPPSAPTPSSASLSFPRGACPERSRMDGNPGFPRGFGTIPPTKSRQIGFELALFFQLCDTVSSHNPFLSRCLRQIAILKLALFSQIARSRRVVLLALGSCILNSVLSHIGLAFSKWYTGTKHALSVVERGTEGQRHRDSGARTTFITLCLWASATLTLS